MHTILQTGTAVLLLGVCLTGVPYVQRYYQTQGKPQPLTLTAFSWDNCGLSTDIFRVQSFSVKPDPIVLPGTVNISFAIQYLQDFGSPLKASVLIAKKLGRNYISIPCVGEFGSCEYDDFCQMPLGLIPQCPQQLVDRNISCQCPFSKGIYSLPPTSVDLVYLPLLAGDYHARINLSTVVGTAPRHVGCYEVYLTLSDQYSMFRGLRP